MLTTSFKYVRGASAVSLSFLMRVFFSTSVVFAGIYSTISIYQKHAFVEVSFGRGKKLFEQSYWSIIYEFLYFSVTTMTTTGYGSISPRTPIAQVFCSLEMIVSQLFTQVILSIGLQSVAMQLDRAGRLSGSLSFDNVEESSDSECDTSLRNWGISEESTDGASELNKPLL